MCAKNAPYSLQSDLRGMNVHRKKFHKEAAKLISLVGLEKCQAEHSGPKGPLLEVPVL